MSQPLSSITGVSSGIDWKSMVDQIVAAEASRQMKPVDNHISLITKQQAAYSSYTQQLAKLQGAAAAIATADTFNAFSAVSSSSHATGRSLISGNATARALPGSYNVEVQALATAAKVGGAYVTDPATAQHLSGDFLINGVAVNVSAADSLNAIRDKINALNAGPQATHVQASILTTSPGQSRLVLTSQDTGAQGIDLIDGPAGVLHDLGFLDAGVVANTTNDGQSQSARFTSATNALATMMGGLAPGAGTIKVGGTVISIDANADSLTTIASKINAAGGTAAVAAEVAGGVTRYRLVMPASVTADQSDPASAAILSSLGFTVATRGAVAQQITTGATLTDAATSTNATGSTKLVDLAGGGRAGDTISIRGTRADGNTVSVTFSITDSATVDDLLSAMNASGAFGGGSTPATATLVNGRISLTDQQGGNSQLGLVLTANNESGSTLSFGNAARTVTGRTRDIVAASDARLVVDGTIMTRRTNAISDVIDGVSLNLLQAEVGTRVTLNVALDTSRTVAGIQAFAQAYNDTVALVQQLRAPDQPLAGDSVMRNTVQQFTNLLLSNIPGLSDPAYLRPGSVGVSLDKTGQLQVDSAKLIEALNVNPSAVQQIFVQTAQGQSSAVRVLGSSSSSGSGTFDIVVTQAAQVAAVTGGAFGGAYVAGATPDTMTIALPGTSKMGTIALGDGDSLNTIVGKLNTMFQAQGMRLQADGTTGALRLQHLDAGSNASFSVSYTPGTADGTAALGIAAGTYSGVDIAGTIGGNPATGIGTVLTGSAAPSGASPWSTTGLQVDVSAGAIGAVGRAQNTFGLGAAFRRLVDRMTQPGAGVLPAQQASLQSRIDRDGTRKLAIQARLDALQKQLTNQFTAMEVAVSKVRGLTTALGGQWNTLAGNGKNSN